MKVVYSKEFIKALKKCPLDIIQKFRLREEIFINDNRHPLLRCHLLSGKLAGLRSFNVTADYRVIYQDLGEGSVIFRAIGTHNQLYK
jgi:addiction module RelE/StbE family toxin